MVHAESRCGPSRTQTGGTRTGHDVAENASLNCPDVLLLGLSDASGADAAEADPGIHPGYRFFGGGQEHRLNAMVQGVPG